MTNKLNIFANDFNLDSDDTGNFYAFCIGHDGDIAKARVGAEEILPTLFKMPCCGRVYLIEAMWQVPCEDTKCICGHEKSWFVKYMEQK